MNLHPAPKMNESKVIYNLNCFRTLFCFAASINYFCSFLPMHKRFLPVFEIAWNQLPIIVSPSYYGFFMSDFLGLRVIDFWDGAICFSLLVAGSGYRSRFFIVVALALMGALEFVFSTNLRFNSLNTTFITLLLLSLSSAAHGYSLFRKDFRSLPNREENGSYPTLMALKLVVPGAFLSAFLSKIKNGGDSWFNGEAMQGYMYFVYLQNTSNHVTLWIAENIQLCLFFSFLTLFLEALSIFAPASKRTAALLISSLILFQVGILLVMKINFLSMFAPIWLAYIDYAAIFQLLSSRGGESKHAAQR